VNLESLYRAFLNACMILGRAGARGSRISEAIYRDARNCLLIFYLLLKLALLVVLLVLAICLLRTEHAAVSFRSKKAYQNSGRSLLALLS
jgi:hypothetical protein